MDKRDTAMETVSNLFAAKMWFHAMAACCKRLSKLAPNPGRFSVVGRGSAAWRKTVLLSDRIAPEQRVAAGKVVIDAHGTLIVVMRFVADI
jgi:hypothetical protein